MRPTQTRRFRRRRAFIAVTAAVLVHAVLFSAMGLVRPRLRLMASDNNGPDVELQLLPRPVPAGSEAVTASARQARRNALAASPLSDLLPLSASPPTASAQAGTPSPAVIATGEATGAGLADCAPEDLPLLTLEEKTRCRNQIEVAGARRARALDDAGRADRVAAMRQLPKVDAIPANKRAYYDAVQAAKATRDSFAVWDRMRTSGKSIADLTDTKIVKPDIHDVINCTMKFGVNKGKPAGSRYGLKLGPFDCPMAPAPSFLTEEAKVAPP